jgi:hypothetical protein
MSVFTIYCHGSGGHRHKADKEIVANFGRKATGREYQDYLILDGVGGAASKKKYPGFAMTGSFNWADKNKSPKGRTAAELGGGHATSGGFFGSKRANAAGEGVEDNARHALVTLANLNPLPTNVNMIGWSRGAVTALVIANMMYDPTSTEGLFRSIDVNIFAVDPVAGKEAGHGPNAETRRFIPPTVKNYLGILATGENRLTFKPQDLSRVHIGDPNASNVAFLPFPGKHSTVAQNCDRRAVEVSDIIWTLADRFLKTFGTRQKTQPPLQTLTGILEAYSGIVVKKPIYDSIKQKGAYQRMIGKGFGKREFNQHLHHYTSYAGYFINEHHRQVFLLCCPNVYDWLFTTRYGVDGGFARTVQADDSVYNELNQLRFCQDLIRSLAQLGVKPEQKSAFNLPPAGQFFDVNAGRSVQVDSDLGQMGLL